MDKKEALEICLDLWTWVTENFDEEQDINVTSTKGRWPGWKNNGGNVPSVVADCPCCHYVEVNYGGDAACVYCPLKGYAWTKFCDEGKSPWRDFEDDPKLHGGRMVDACKRALADLEKSDKKETLKICLKLWAWVDAEYKGSGVDEIVDLKEAWPGWVQNGGTVQKMENDCPCCEFVVNRYSNCHDGSICPLTGYAWEKSCMSRKNTQSCYVDNDPAGIVDACLRALEDLAKQ